MSDEQNQARLSGGWVEFQLGGPLPALEVFAEFLNDLGAGGAIFSEDPAGAPGAHMVTAFLALIQANPSNVARIHKRVEEVKEQFAGAWTDLKITRVDDRDWAEEWKKGLKPERLEPGIWIVPSFLPVPAEATGEPVIRLDPGMAFGTGQHFTTRMSMKMVGEAVRDGARSVLDLGTGTGILAMTALLFGAERVLALDLDPMALRVARENLEFNGLLDKIELEQGVSDPGVVLDRPPFDLIAANLFAEMIVKFLPFIARHLAARGKVVLSGILLDREQAVEAGTKKAGLATIDRIEEQGWVTMLMERASDAS
ncbi:MAG TPA: 50S ribosomal protein L11 methyltransferase [bacterium]|nr:50S ribosomal protein L11 methyltransferase [bacterium]